MENTAKKPGLSVVSSGKRKATPPGAAGKSSGKKTCAPVLALIPTAKKRSGLRAPSFVQYELKNLAALIEEMCACDVANDLDFRFYVERATRSEICGLELQDTATRLDLVPITLQRWSRGVHLPFALPRRAYLDGLIEILEARILLLKTEGADALLATPRRGSRRQAPTAPMKQTNTSSSPSKL